MPGGPINPNPHLDYVEKLLREVKRRQENNVREKTPSEGYLVRDEGATFWELIALRVRGASSLFLAAAQFQRQGPQSGPDFARRPLSLYLSAPPKELGMNKTARPANLLEVLLPEAGESIPQFQERMRDGESGHVLYVDTDSLEFAFDFRFENPSIEREQGVYQGAPERHLFRTVRGHVLSGITHGLHRRLHQNVGFFSLRAPVQHSEKGTNLLPPMLVLHRNFIALDAQLGVSEPVNDWLTTAAPFLGGAAQSRHLLLPDPHGS